MVDFNIESWKIVGKSIGESIHDYLVEKVKKNI